MTNIISPKLTSRNINIQINFPDNKKSNWHQIRQRFNRHKRIWVSFYSNQILYERILDKDKKLSMIFL